MLCLAAACGEPAVLTVGPVGYTADEVGLLTDAQRGVLTDLTAFGVVVAEGRAEELAEPFVEKELRSLMLQRLAMEVAVDDAGMDEAALRAAYARAPEPELVVRHLVVVSERWRPEAHRDSARARAEEALRKARGGVPFERVVEEYSDEPGAAERGGLLRPGREGSWVPEFWAAAADLRPGELSPVVETEYGFHVIRLEERRPIPFEEVRGDVLERLVDLPSAVTRAQEWAEEQSGALTIDTAAVRAWLADTTGVHTLATWAAPGGAAALTVADLETHLATLGRNGAGRTDPVRPSDLAGALAAVEAAARAELLAGRAAARGLEPSIAQRHAVQQRWAARLGGWAETLGFRPGMGPRQVKAAALEALGSARQGAAIARSELAEISGVLRTLVPISRAGGPTS